MKKDNESAYMPPLVSKVAQVESENPLLAGSIIPDDQEVSIDQQEKQDDITYDNWVW